MTSTSIVKKEIQSVPATQDPQTLRLLVDPAKPGQHPSPMSTQTLVLEITTSAGTLTARQKESGATPLTRTNDGSIARFRDAFL